MARDTILGLGLTFALLFIQYRYRDMPAPITAAGIAFGVALMLWPYLPFPQKYNAPIFVALCLLALCVGVADWVYEIYSQTEITERPIQNARPVTPKASPQHATSAAGSPVVAPEKPHVDPRRRFVVPLRAFYAEGDEIIRFLAGANTEDEFKKRQDRLWDWTTRIGLWTCKNMGESAMAKAIPLTLDPYVAAAHPIPGEELLSAQKNALLTMIGVVQERLSSLIEHDTWDPIGEPILPKEGCEAVVGKATDPAAKF